MLSYKLCKQLKRRGFPQPKYSSRFKGFYTDAGIPKAEAVVYVPTLSELIEALGTGEGNSWFNLMGSFTHDFGWEATWNVNWVAEDKVDKTKAWGKTPEIAVTKLYLKLNK
jgi:hypothetical protein